MLSKIRYIILTLSLAQREVISDLVVKEEKRADVDAVARGDGCSSVESIFCHRPIHDRQVGKPLILGQLIDDETRVFIVRIIQRESILPIESQHETKYDYFHMPRITHLVWASRSN